MGKTDKITCCRFDCNIFLLGGSFSLKNKTKSDSPTTERPSDITHRSGYRWLLYTDDPAFACCHERVADGDSVPRVVSPLLLYKKRVGNIKKKNGL